MKNVLITGGAGFIGSHVAAYHLKKGDSVWVIDSLSTGRKENIALFLKDEKFQFSEEDVCSGPTLKKAVEWADRVYHLAAMVGQYLVLKNPTQVLSKNILGCEKVLEAAASSKKRKEVLIASSSCVYDHGRENRDVFHEEDSLEIPSNEYLQTTYLLSKIVNEVTALSYAQKKNVFCCIARIFNSIGLKQRSTYGMVVPAFIEQALSGKPITVYGDGSQGRSFCDVRDTVHAFDLLFKNPASSGTIVNVGSDHEISIEELAYLVKKLSKSSSEIQKIPYREAYGMDFQDVFHRKPSLKKLKELTGFVPQFSLQETLQEMIFSKKG